MRTHILILCAAAAIGVGFRAANASGKPDPLPLALSYQMTPGQLQKYHLKADIKASVPVFDSPTPIPLEAVIDVVYVANPKTQLADGTADVVLEIASASLEVGAPGTDKIPFPIELDQVREVLNQQVTISKLGEVKKSKGGGDMPFGVSIPGVDPKRLYALLFPVVFQSGPVKAGDTWRFNSELLGGPGAKPSFTATVLPSEEGRAAVKIKEAFEMKVDQAFDAEKKPVTNGKAPHRHKKGVISGQGTLTFDPTIGLFIKSVVDIKANINDTLVGKPSSNEEPKQILSNVDAKVTVELRVEKKPESSQ